MSVPEGYKSLGKIGISYKGDYNSNTAYERLDAVFHNGSTYLAIKDAPDGAPRDDKTNWIYLAKGYDGETVDVADSEIAFTDSETRENIASGEKVSTVFGKVKKFFTDLTAPAFAQMITTKEDLLATKVTGYVPDAKAVADGFADVNGKLNYKHLSIKDGTAGITIPGDWIEAYVDITFSLNPQYYFTFHLIRDDLLSKNKKYLQGYYVSENDHHNLCLLASTTGAKLENYTYNGQDIGQNCEMNLFYR